MPPKKAAAKDADSADKEQLQKNRAEITTLNRLLELKTYEAVEARALEHRWRERAEAAEAALEQSRLDMADIKADMARQHATLQEHASQQVHVLEERLVELQAQLAAAQQTAGKADAGSKQLMLDKEQQAAAHQQELQLLHKQYAAILQDTLSKMRSKLQDEYNAACEGA